jgi:N-acyl amino acid synthase of PEP-CTERM/exosortase system
LKSYRLDCEQRSDAGQVTAPQAAAIRRAAPSNPGAPATHAEALKSAFELRYQVYCIECSFLSPEDYPDGVESDEHDDGAAHFYAFDADDELVGYVRLVRPGADALFPIQKRCTLSVDGAALPPVGESAEISRLMVRGDYRRRRGDRLSGVTAKQNNAVFAGDRRCEAPQILLGLYRQMYAYSREHGIRHWYAAMERPLARSLLRLDFAFRPIGPQTDYYGPVAPYVADLRELEAQVGQRHPALLTWLQEPERRTSHPSPLSVADDDLDSCHLDQRSLARLRQVVDPSDGEDGIFVQDAPDLSIDAILGERQCAALQPAVAASVADTMTMERGAQQASRQPSSAFKT